MSLVIYKQAKGASLEGKYKARAWRWRYDSSSELECTPVRCHVKFEVRSMLLESWWFKQSFYVMEYWVKGGMPEGQG